MRVTFGDSTEAKQFECHIRRVMPQGSVESGNWSNGKAPAEAWSMGSMVSKLFAASCDVLRKYGLLRHTNSNSSANEATKAPEELSLSELSGFNQACLNEISAQFSDGYMDMNVGIRSMYKTYYFGLTYETCPCSLPEDDPGHVSEEQCISSTWHIPRKKLRVMLIEKGLLDSDLMFELDDAGNLTTPEFERPTHAPRWTCMQDMARLQRAGEVHNRLSEVSIWRAAQSESVDREGQTPSAVDSGRARLSTSEKNLREAVGGGRSSLASPDSGDSTASSSLASNSFSVGALPGPGLEEERQAKLQARQSSRPGSGLMPTVSTPTGSGGGSPAGDSFFLTPKKDDDDTLGDLTRARSSGSESSDRPRPRVRSDTAPERTNSKSGSFDRSESGTPRTGMRSSTSKSDDLPSSAAEMVRAPSSASDGDAIDRSASHRSAAERVSSDESIRTGVLGAPEQAPEYDKLS